MATNTPNLILRKPDSADLANVTTDLAANLDKIDAETLFWQKNIPRCKAIRTTAFACVSGQNVYIPWTSTQYEYYEMWDIANPTRLVAPFAGYYLCQTCITFDVSTAGTIRNIHILRGHDGAQVANGTFPQSSSGWYAGGSIIGETYLAAGQYVETCVHQTSGANLNIRGDAYTCSLSMRMTGR